jgi:hypothetical protein
MYSMFLVIHDMPLSPEKQKIDMDLVRLQMMLAVVDGRITLHPANDDVKSIVFESEDNMERSLAKEF